MTQESIWNFDKNPEKIAFITEQGDLLTYGDLEKICNQYGLFMEGERQLVFLVCDNSIESILIYVSCIQNRIPVLLFDSKLSKEALHSLIGSYQPKWIWCQGEWEMSAGYQVARTVHSFFLYQQKKCKIDIYQELALLLLTSGSTGSKKTVMLSYGNIVSNMQGIAKTLKISNKDKGMFMLPLGYSYGLSVIHSHLERGAAILVPSSKFYQKSFWDFFKREGGTSICGVPYMYHVLKRLKIMEKEFPSLRLITQAGGELEVTEQQYFLHCAVKQKADFAVMYGQTEATARISCFYLNEHPEKIGSVGRVLPGGQLWIEQADKKNLGEIIYQGDNVMLGYAQGEKDLARRQAADVKLFTGDLGYLDEEGYLYIRGRKSRIAKVHGIRINLDELQRKLTVASGEIVYCVEGGECLYVCCTTQVLVEKMGYLLNNLSFDKRMCRIRFIKDIPTNENGKVNYKRLREFILYTGNN